MAYGDIKTFDIVYDGLILKVDAIDVGGGKTQFVIKCITGYADINAIYWGDDIDDKSSVGLAGPLNMNGTKVDWDGAQKLSDPGLGPEGTSKATYLTAGETLDAFTLSVNWEDVDQLGIRATSTSTKEGSIKGVDSGADITKAPDISVSDAECVVEGGKSVFTINLSDVYDYDIKVYYKTASGTATEGDDYTGADSFVIIKAGQTSATVEIQTIDDTEVEGAINEKYTLQLTKAEVQVDVDGDTTIDIDLNLTSKIVDNSGDGCIIDNDEDEPPPEVDNHFPNNGHELSYATFYFGTTSGDTRGVYNGEPVGGAGGNPPDGVYTVKVNFDVANSGDLDDYLDVILAKLIAKDANIDGSTEVLGVGIHAGMGNPATSEKFYALDNDPDEDPIPDPPKDMAQNNEVDLVWTYSALVA